METDEATREEALSLYPELRAELEPLLSLTAELRAMPKVDAPASLRGYKRPVFSAGKAQPREKWWRRLLPLSAPSSGWATPLVRVAAALALVVVATSGTIVASANSLPEEPLYPVKLAVENAQLAIAPNDQARSELELQFAAKRVAEVQSAAQQDNPAAVAQGVALYEQKVDAAVKASEAAAQAAPGAPEKVQETLRQNAEVLKQVQSKVQSEQAQAAIGAAIRRTMAASSGVEAEPDHGAAPTVGVTAQPATAVAASPSPTIAPTAIMAVHVPTATVVMANGNGRANVRPDNADNAGNPDNANRGASEAARAQNAGAADGIGRRDDRPDMRQRGQGVPVPPGGDNEDHGAAGSTATSTQAAPSPVTPSATPTPTPTGAASSTVTAAAATVSATATSTPVPAARDRSGGRDRSHGEDSGWGNQRNPSVDPTATATPVPDNSRGQDNGRGGKNPRDDSRDRGGPAQDVLNRILGNFQNMMSGR